MDVHTSIAGRTQEGTIGPGSAARVGAWFPWVTFLFALAAAGVLLSAFLDLSEDNGWYLYLAAKVLDGATLYTDLVEVNPPLSIWLAIPAVLLSRTLGISITVAFALWIVALLSVALAAFGLVLRQFHSVGGSRRWLLLSGVSVLLLIGFGGDFGQREHLSVAFVLPYLATAAAAAARTRVPTSLKLVSGALAAVGLAFKPHFVPILLLVEMYVLMQAGRWRSVVRVDPIACGIGLLLYAGAVVLFAPEVFAMVRTWADAYLQFAVVPLPSVVVRLSTILVVAALLLRWQATGAPPLVHLQGTTVIAGVVYLLAAIVQQKGWAHHFLSADVAAGASLLAAFVNTHPEPSRSDRIGNLLRRAPLMLLFILCIEQYQEARLIQRDRAEWRHQFEAAIDHYAVDGTVLFLSTQMLPAFPLVNWTQTEWALRYPSLWMLREPYEQHCGSGETMRRGKTTDAAAAVEQLAFTHMLEDIRQRRPSVIFVEPLRTAEPYCWSFEEYLRHHRQLGAELGRYRAVGETFGFSVLVRSDTAAVRDQTGETAAHAALRATR